MTRREQGLTIPHTFHVANRRLPSFLDSNDKTGGNVLLVGTVGSNGVTGGFAFDGAAIFFVEGPAEASSSVDSALRFLGGMVCRAEE